MPFRPHWNDELEMGGKPFGVYGEMLFAGLRKKFGISYNDLAVKMSKIV